MPTQHDNDYKLLFSHPEMVRDLLLGFVPGDWCQHARFETLERVNASYVSESDKQRHDDMVWRLKVGPRWVWVYLLLEFQSQPDEWMAVRMMVYVGLLAQHLIKEGQLDQGKLPPLLPMVLYKGSRPWSSALDVVDCFAPGLPALEPYRPRMLYHLIDEARLKLSPSDEVRNVTEALFKLEHSANPADIARLAHAMGQALQAPEHQKLRRTLNVWLRRLIRRKMPDIATDELDQIHDLLKGPTMLEETLERLYNEAIEKGLSKGLSKGHSQGLTQGITEGISQGLTLGRSQGIAMMLARVIEQRFSPVPPWAYQRLQSASVERLEAWSEQMFSAPTLEALLDGSGATH
ncbi:MAG: hypothetical protein EKK45_08875 [Curvibacter sp.]|nr:MAG: hypothetical protein EKK45_08875 [Curvibacter sp.]